MKWKKYFPLILGLLLIILGILVFLTPKATHLQYQQQVRSESKVFQQEIRRLEKLPPIPGLPEPVPPPDQPPETPLDQLYFRMQRDNEKLFETRQPQAAQGWPYEQALIDLRDYGFTDNVLGYLTVPRLGIRLPVMLGANQENMRRGAGHMTYTSYPIGGPNTNCVLSAHRGFARTSMFREIEDLEIGDPVYLENFRETLTYRVSEIQIVSLTDTDSVKIQEGRDLLTLLTCHPLGMNYQRYLVFCERDLSQ